MCTALTQHGMFTWIEAAFRIHFGFSKTEANGALILLLLTSTCLLVPQGIKWYFHRYPEANHSQDIALLEHTLATLEAYKQKPKQSTAPIQTYPTNTCPQPLGQLQPFDINTADEAQLRAVKGIGPVLSARIVKFRNQLGGFTSQAQYQEVYGLPPEVATHLAKHTYIDTSFCPTKLDINTADVHTLAAHPYITYQQAQGIVNYRTQHGPFAEKEALHTLVLMNQATLERLHPYLYISP